MSKKSMKSWAKYALAAGVSLFIANNAAARSAVLDMNNQDWSNPAAWTSDLLPVAADDVFIRNGYNVTVSTDVGSVTRFYIGEHANSSGTVNMVSGKLVSTTTSSTDRSTVGRPVANATGTGFGVLNLSGGTLQMGAVSGTEVLNIGVNTATTRSTGIFTVSGGTFDGRLLVGSAIADDVGGDIFRVVGNGGTIGTASTVGNALEVRASGTLEFIFGATGISTLNYGTSGVGGTASFATGSDLIIDGAAYTGGANTFTLITAGTLSQATKPTISLIGFDPKYEAVYDYNTSTDILSVTVVPEPATIGMVGLGAIALLVARRQIRK